METFRPPERIETIRLVLSRLRYEEAEEIFYAYASKPEATQYLSWPRHTRIEDTRNFLSYAIRAWNEGTDFSFSIRRKSDQRLVGSFGLIHDLGKIQFGYVISPTFWRNGYATEACQAMMALLKKERTLYRVSTFVDTENISSIRVLEKSGLIREATLVQWFRFINQGNAPKDCSLYYLPLPPKETASLS